MQPFPHTKLQMFRLQYVEGCRHLRKHQIQTNSNEKTNQFLERSFYVLQMITELGPQERMFTYQLPKDFPTLKT